MTQLNLNKLSYGKYIWKLRLDIEKWKSIRIRSKNIQVEYKLSNREIKKVNTKCDQGVGFDDTFKADNYIFSLVSRANRMIGWMIWNFISREANVISKIYKT